MEDRDPESLWNHRRSLKPLGPFKHAWTLSGVDLEGLPAIHKQNRLYFLEWERWVSVKQIPEEFPIRDAES